MIWTHADILETVKRLTPFALRLGGVDLAEEVPLIVCEAAQRKDIFALYIWCQYRVRERARKLRMDRKRQITGVPVYVVERIRNTPWITPQDHGRNKVKTNTTYRNKMLALVKSGDARGLAYIASRNASCRKWREKRRNEKQ